MSFEVAAPFRPGDAADFRIALPDAGDDGGVGEVRGTVRVLRIVDSFPDAPTLFSGEVVAVRREDLPVLEAWLGQHSGPVRRRFEAVSGSESPDVEVNDPEDTDALDPVALPHLSRTESGSSEPYGFTDASQAEDLRLAGREAIRTALRRGLQARARGRHRASAPRTWMQETPRRAAAQARSWLQGEASAAPAPAASAPMAEPSIEIQSTSTPVRITVRWATPGGFRRDWERHLRGGGLFLPCEEALPRNRALELRLELPSGEAIRCPAQVVAPMPTGAGLSVRLTREQKERLEMEPG